MYNLTNVQIGKLMAFCASLGLAIGVAGVLTIAGVYYTRSPIDYRMETGCIMPRAEGEATMAVILNGRLICWRYQ